MKIAILSDIHSNVFALKAVHSTLEQEKIDGVFLLGDQFGYYPWAVETYNLLQQLNILAAIKGNHDVLVYTHDAKKFGHLEYFPLALQNWQELSTHTPTALEWLENLYPTITLNWDTHKITLCHGIPSDPIHGRYYPDDTFIYEWLPAQNEILLIGHTHYPLVRTLPGGGIVFNPGSVGQPRDGNPSASWGLWDTTQMEFKIMRSPYDITAASNILKDLKWNGRAIRALNKNYSGKL